MNAEPPTRPVLVLACGNPSRGDDAMGPLLIECLARRQRAGELQQVDLLTDFQLQIEHALDLQGRGLVVFVDAAHSGPEPFSFLPVLPELEPVYTTHAMAPGAVLRVFEQVIRGDVPPAWLLAIRGHAFDLGSTITAAAGDNLSRSAEFLLRLLRDRESGAAGVSSPPPISA
jgi:hydrogenase maturation protease